MTHEEIAPWFAERLPNDWFTEAPEVMVDRDEILVIGTLPEPSEEATEEDGVAARRARIQDFREETRSRRMKIASEAQMAFRRKVSWGARSGGETYLFAHLAVPAMTRLRMPERKVLDTLVDAGVARSRSDALSWCVRLVRQHEADWLSELREALRKVEEVREQGPGT